MKSSAAFDKNTVEFVTVAAEYCAYLEQVFDKEPERVLDVFCHWFISRQPCFRRLSPRASTWRNA